MLQLLLHYVLPWSPVLLSLLLHPLAFLSLRGVYEIPGDKAYSCCLCGLGARRLCAPQVPCYLGAVGSEEERHVFSPTPQACILTALPHRSLLHPSSVAVLPGL